MAKQPSKKNKKVKTERVKLHRSFKRSYREDYKRELNVPGIMAHLFETFKILFKNWKTFGLLLVVIVALNAFLVGLMNEDTYVQFQNIFDQISEENNTSVNQVAKAGLLLISTITTGGFNANMSEVQGVFAVILIIITILVTIYLLRHIMAGHKVKLRDGLYNACTPLLSAAAIIGIIFLQCIPIFIFIIGYSTAVSTNFLATPFYALVFFIFAVAMFLLSGYWLSSSLIALVAVTAPGLYPMKAMHAASDLMAGRRFKFMIRIMALILALLIMWVIVMIPLILFDLWMKTFEWTAGIPFVSFCLMIMTVFSIIFASTYLYIYYRWMLDYDEE